jgi:hypothetical protein
MMARARLMRQVHPAFVPLLASQCSSHANQPEEGRSVIYKSAVCL